MSRKRKNKITTRDNPNQAANAADAYYAYWLDLCQQVACATLKWENVPVEIDRRFLTLTLLERGLSVFFLDEDTDKFLSLMATPGGAYNMYNNPIAFNAYGANGSFRRLLQADECVPLWLNYRRNNMRPTFQRFAARLAYLDRAMDCNLSQQMTPVIITCPEEKRLTVNNLVSQWQGGEPVVIGVDVLMDGVETKYLAADAPFVYDKLQDAQNNLWRDYLTRLGVDNSPVDKPERVQTAEVESNNVELSTMRLISLDCLREGCKAINRRWGLDMWVDFNQDFSSEMWEIVNTAGGTEDGDYPGLEVEDDDELS